MEIFAYVFYESLDGHYKGTKSLNVYLMSPPGGGGRKSRHLSTFLEVKKPSKKFCETSTGVLLWTLTRNLAMKDRALGAFFTKFRLADFCDFDFIL